MSDNKANIAKLAKPESINALRVKYSYFDDDSTASLGSTVSLDTSLSESSDGGTPGSKRARTKTRSTFAAACSRENYELQNRLSLNSTFQKLCNAGVATTPLDDVPYVHGGYAAAAPLMVGDRIWMDLLQRLMPDAHNEAVLLIEKEGATDNTKLMKWAENNPVVAAYGILQGKARVSEGKPSTPKIENPSEFSSLRSSAFISSKRSKEKYRIRSREPNTTAIEWDVFLDPSIVENVEQVMYKASLLADDIHNRVLADVEVDRHVGRLIARMLLAHGSTSQLVSEALGLAPKYNFAQVVESTLRRSERTSSSLASSGIFVEKYLSIFNSALRMGQALSYPTSSVNKCSSSNFALHRNGAFNYSTSITQRCDLQLNDTQSGCSSFGVHIGNPEEIIVPDEQSGICKKSDIEHGDLPADIVSPTMCGLFLCLGISDPNSDRIEPESTSMTASLRAIQDFLGVPLRVILDLKSRRVPPRVWARVIDHLRQRGLCVQGIGSFDILELRLIAKFCLTPITQTIFFHSAGDLQRACHAKEIQRGDTVYFNAGSLLWQKPTLFEAADIQCWPRFTVIEDKVSVHYVVQPFAHPRSSLENLPPDLKNISSVEDYQRHFCLNIGLYVQEFSICEEALEVLVNFVNFNRSVYTLGLAWGGLNGAIVTGVNGDGYWNQRFMGRNWNTDIGPQDKLEMVGEDSEIVREALLVVAFAQAGTANDDDVHELSNAIQNGACGSGSGQGHFSNVRHG